MVYPSLLISFVNSSKIRSSVDCYFPLFSIVCCQLNLVPFLIIGIKVICENHFYCRFSILRKFVPLLPFQKDSRFPVCDYYRVFMSSFATIVIAIIFVSLFIRFFLLFQLSVFPYLTSAFRLFFCALFYFV